MIKLGIIHFLPIELYPPVLNLLKQLGEGQNPGMVYVFTTKTNIKKLTYYKPENSKVKIIRLSAISKYSLWRYIQYTYFFLYVILFLLLCNIKRIVYYESFSSFPAWVMHKLRNDIQIYIHYHEYISPKEYLNGPPLVRLFNLLEKKLYKKAIWISQTNHYRMREFSNDNGNCIRESIKYILPNHPPLSWKRQPVDMVKPEQLSESNPLKIIYVGSLSLDTMYTKEFAAWVQKQKGKVIWDIYSLNISKAAKCFLTENNFQWIDIYDGVDYSCLPDILKNYHVGVILYNGHIPNYIFNAPNKLFEYVACGLDVWFPEIMIGSLDYVTNGCYPKIISIDFENLVEVNLDVLIDRGSLLGKELNYFSELVLDEFIKKLNDND